MTRIFEEENDTKSKLSIKPFLKLFKYSIRHLPIFLGLILALILTSFYDASLFPMMSKALINALDKQAIIGGNIGDFIIDVQLIFNISFSVNFKIFIVILVSLNGVRCITIFFVFILTDYLAMLIMNDLRRDSFKKIQQLSFSYFDKTPTGWILARMQNDTSSVSDLLGWGLIRIIWSFFEILFLLVTLFQSSYQLGLILLATTPLVIIAAPIFQHYLLKFSRIARNAYSNFIRWLSECINGASTIKTLAIEEKTTKECEEIVNDIKVKVRKRLKVQIFFAPFISLLAQFTTALLILLGLKYIGAPKAKLIIDVSILVIFINSVGHVYQQLTDFTDLYSEFVANQANAEKIMNLIDQKPELEDRPDVIEKYGDIFNPKVENYPKMEGEIEFKDVDFSYLKDTEVIHKLNLKIKKGTSVAIVGETGSGKTTIANLLCRFYEPTNGEILIDGISVKDRSVGWLRNGIAYVQQNPFIFSGSFKDNIRYGRWDASLADIKNSAKTVDIDNFIENQEHGYETILRTGINDLSLGQKQLISFARAILKDPKILILDEATSSIDTATEAKIQEAIKNILKNRTSIIIAHRLSTIVNCDRIILLDKGRIIEDGSHLELMKKRGAYFDLYMAQFKDLDLETQMDVFALEKDLLKSH